MLEAKSMYLAGEILSAEDIETFEQPKQLGLICPFCSEALFVKSGGTRERGGKLQFIESAVKPIPSGVGYKAVRQGGKSSAGEQLTVDFSRVSLV